MAGKQIKRIESLLRWRREKESDYWIYGIVQELLEVVKQQGKRIEKLEKSRRK